MEVIKKNLRLENMLSKCLFFLTSDPKYAHKLYVYKKECISKDRTGSSSNIIFKRYFQ